MAAPVAPPLLHDGDRLSREEFLRRWESMPDLKFAELIDGVVYLASPVSAAHNDFEAFAGWWLASYAGETAGCWAGSNGTWLMNINAPQPDLNLRVLPEFGGQSRIEGAYFAGAPELAAEIAASSAPRDPGLKSELYERSGVREYLVMLVDDRRVVWRELHDGRYGPGRRGRHPPLARVSRPVAGRGGVLGPRFPASPGGAGTRARDAGTRGVRRIAGGRARLTVPRRGAMMDSGHAHPISPCPWRRPVGAKARL